MTTAVRLMQHLTLAAAISAATACPIAGTRAFADSQSNTPPRIDVNYPHPQPPYPDAAQVNGEQGSVVLNVRVLANGRVRNITVDQSSGFDDLDNAAIEGVLRWRFLPAVRDGDTTSEWTKVTIVYQLPKLAPPPASTTPKS